MNNDEEIDKILNEINKNKSSSDVSEKSDAAEDVGKNDEKDKNENNLSDEKEINEETKKCN
ncbi:MAG: hypothetical protein LIO43_03270 [Clostridiales bacterium]|nr:hypothetical protein [Clostridiales bacterium]